MANIATVFVRLFRGRRDGPWLGISHSEILATLMDGYGGSSYCVPVWLGYRSDEEATWLDVQYGAKWSPAYGPAALWERREEADLGALWVRWHDGGGDFDQIYALHDADAKRPCRYTFDEIEVRIGDVVERRRLSGTYLCGNERALPQPGRLLPSPTTQPGKSTSALGDVEPPATADLVRDLHERAQEITFFHRQRMVHLSERRSTRWLDYALDDWDNCADEAFLHAVEGSKTSG